MSGLVDVNISFERLYMKIFTRNKFRSTANYHRIIKVTKVQRNPNDAKFDLCHVVDLNHQTGKKVPGTERTVYADSIRRRYYSIS